MAIEIDNLIAGICAVDIAPVFVGAPPKYVAGRANAGFEPFAPSPALPTNSERLFPGVYRLHTHQQFNFGDAGATPTVTVNQPPFPFIPSALAFGIPIIAGIPGSDIIVVLGVQGSEGFVTNDANFTLVLWQFPVQATG